MRYILFLFIILAFSSQAQQPWQCHTIDNMGSGADGVKFGDINNDGRIDITSGWEESGITKVYLQPKLQLIKEKWRLVIVGKTPNVEDAVFADINNDGELDVVSCTENNSQKIFVHWNLGIDYLKSGNWKQEVLPASAGVMSWMYAEPMEVDGRDGTDLIAAGKGENAAIGWFEAPVDENDLNGWKWHEISKVGWIMSILREDMDSDGDLDLIITDRKGELRACRWLENPGLCKMQKQAWENHIIGATHLEVMFMCMADLDGDNKKEILVAERSDNTIHIFSQEKTVWREEIISLPPFTGKAKSVEVGDINNDGLADLVVSTNTLGKNLDGLIWLDGRTLPVSGEKKWHSISGRHNAKYDKVELMDLDKDGDLDIIICEENFGDNSEGLGLVWYENPTIK